MPSGFVTRWLDDKGFGFAAPDDGGEDIFVHGNVLTNATKLSTGERVHLELQPGRDRSGRLRAQSCKIFGVRTVSGEEHNFPNVKDSDCELALDSFLQTADVKPAERRSSLPLLQRFLAQSSLECQFLVVSDQRLVENVPTPTQEEFEKLVGLVSAYIDGCRQQSKVFLTDFEGEMPGHGGELSSAALLESSVLDPTTLKPRSSQAPFALGLLLDLRSFPCVGLLRKLMDSSILKLMWGADCDVQTLLYQEHPQDLRIRPAMVIDAQLAFSTDERRLGMARMLERVPKRLLDRLPDKEQIDWDAFHSMNQRALTLPLSSCDAAYAMDDLHRIEAIIASNAPSEGSYKAAVHRTNGITSDIEKDPFGLKSLRKNERYFSQYDGRRKTTCAVRIMRHVLSLRLRGLDLGDHEVEVGRIFAAASAELLQANVAIPSKLSFSGDEVAEKVSLSSASSVPSSDQTQASAREESRRRPALLASTLALSALIVILWLLRVFEFLGDSIFKSEV